MSVPGWAVPNPARASVYWAGRSKRSREGNLPMAPKSVGVGPWRRRESTAFFSRVPAPPAPNESKMSPSSFSMMVDVQNK